MLYTDGKTVNIWSFKRTALEDSHLHYVEHDDKAVSHFATTQRGKMRK